MINAVMVICRDVNIRKFYVENLRVRGVNAIGLPRLEHDPDEGLQPDICPTLILIWGEIAQIEVQVQNARELYEPDTPIILVVRDRPSNTWLSKWRIAACLSQLSDSRELYSFIQPWLSSAAPRNGNDKLVNEELNHTK